MSEAPTYTIRTVSDFAAVPEDRLTVCVAEFLAWLHLRALSLKVLDGLPVKWPEDFVWIDDGLHRMDATITDGKTTIPFVSGVIRGFEGPPHA